VTVVDDAAAETVIATLTGSTVDLKVPKDPHHQSTPLRSSEQGIRVPSLADRHSFVAFVGGHSDSQMDIVEVFASIDLECKMSIGLMSADEWRTCPETEMEQTVVSHYRQYRAHRASTPWEISKFVAFVT